MNPLLRKLGAKLRLSLFPTAQDKEVMRWFAEGGEERARYEYDLDSDSLVMDLGGYRGQWASDIYARYSCHVLVFEPVKSFAARIRERFERNPRIEVFPLALGASRRQEVISLGEDGSSVYRPGAARESIDFEDVAAFFASHGIDAVDLMKINIEGGEYELLDRLIEVDRIKDIRHLQIQFHDLDAGSAAHMDRICAVLAKTHRPTYRYRFVWENWTRRD